MSKKKCEECSFNIIFYSGAIFILALIGLFLVARLHDLGKKYSVLESAQVEIVKDNALCHIELEKVEGVKSCAQKCWTLGYEYNMYTPRGECQCRMVR